MWSWLQERGQAISAIASMSMLVIWVLYFQLLLRQYRHRVRPMILINRDAGDTLDARCIVANMSAEPVYVEQILVARGAGGSVPARSIISTGARHADKASTAQDVRKQGPLKSGETVDVGSYRDLLQPAAKASQQDGAGSRAFTIIVVATYTAEDRLVAAERTFDVSGSRLRPRTYAARQIRSGRQRRRLERLISRL